MKKWILSIVMVLSVTAFGTLMILTAQDGPGDGGGEGVELTMLTNLLLDNFELAQTWEGAMPRDQGLIRIRRIPGAAGEVAAKGGEGNKYILGARIDYFKTGYNWFSVTPPRRVKVPGVTSEFSVYVAGRNYEHKLSMVISDYFGKLHKIGNEPMTFLGWKKLTFTVHENIPQRDYGPVSQDFGIYFIGMRVDCDPRFTHGKYYVYFDDLEAKTDLYDENFRNEDDPIDNW